MKKKVLAVGLSHNPNRRRDMLSHGITWEGVARCVCAHFGNSAPDLVWIVYEEESDRRRKARTDD
ncbi:MAG: hypothetical protein IJS19_02965 [Muribaculaceae bacterium]|nr:hypothetical protein [Muribaculaceae bacterium]